MIINLFTIIILYMIIYEWDLYMYNKCVIFMNVVLYGLY